MSAPSGKFVLRLAPELHRMLQDASMRENVSLNQYCATRLAAGFGDTSNGATLSVCGVPVSHLKKLLEEANLPVVGCVLFGSMVRGETDAKSDVDLLLVLRSDALPSRELYTIWDKRVKPKFLAAGREFSPQFVALPKSWDAGGGLWFEVALEGRVLWESGTQITSHLIEVRKAMAEGRIERSLSHGHPFWIRKV